FYCGIKLEVAVKYRLKAGMVVDKAYLDDIQLETEKAQAVDKALTHISASPKTRKQIKDFLVKKGYVEAVISYVFERLDYYGYADDRQYCRMYAESVSGKSKKAIEVELLKRGVDKSVIEEELSDFEDDEQEVLALLKKYLRGKPLSKENIYKGCRYLISKGYDYDTVKEISERIDEDTES
ncbi:MAG: regulatory protein RecX, partial [Candidatus Coproplasma sp.]